MTEVYWNLHKRCFSVHERGRVIAHTDHVTLRNAHFVVQRAGYERTIVRSVHAWVRGEVTEASEGLSVTPVLVTYNPFRVGHFVVRATGERIDSACQSAPKFDPLSASNFDPLERRVRTVALAPSELAGVAETGRARVGA